MTNNQSLFGLIDQISEEEKKGKNHYLDMKQYVINKTWRLENCPANWNDMESYEDRRGI